MLSMRRTILRCSRWARIARHTASAALHAIPAYSDPGCERPPRLRAARHTQSNAASQVEEDTSCFSSEGLNAWSALPSFLQLPCSGAAQSDEEAVRVCEALAHAGIVLRFGDCVFLRPQDVVEIMMRVNHSIGLRSTSPHVCAASCHLGRH